MVSQVEVAETDISLRMVESLGCHLMHTTKKKKLVQTFEQSCELEGKSMWKCFQSPYLSFT